MNQILTVALRQRVRTLMAAAMMAALTALALLVAPALNAAGPSAPALGTISWTGGFVLSGTTYAKQGTSLTLDVAATNVSCVKLTGGATAQDNSAPFSFNLTGGAGDGAANITVTGFASSSCTGQSDVKSTSYVLDNTGPTVTGTLSPPANGLGWNNSNVAIAWAASDSGSGVKAGSLSPTSDQVNTPTGTNGVVRTASAQDNLGNQNSGSVTVKLDKGNPVISATRTPAPNANGWNNTNVTIGFGCSDALSGIKSCSGPSTVTTEGANQARTGTAVDNADNSSTATANVSIDKTDPTISGAPVGSPNAAGWYDQDVKVHWTCSDSLSGLSGQCPGDSTISSEGTGLSATQSVSDQAGNSTSATSTPAVKVDKTPPVTNAVAPADWRNTDVQVALTPSDGLSGVDKTYYKVDDGDTKTYSSGITFSSDGAHKLEFWSTDNAGNTESPTKIDVKVDKTAPSITHKLTPAANTNGWNNSDVKVEFACDDATSGVLSCTGDVVVSDEPGAIVTGTAKDNAGNSQTDDATVALDKTPPSVKASVDRDPDKGSWYNGDVTVSFACGDALSGIADGGCPPGQTLGEGKDQSAGGTAVDLAGNDASDGVSGIDVDKTKPTISGKATDPANDDGWYRGDVTIGWTCDDELSGIADGDCPADATIDGEGDDLGAGASVSDRAGNKQSASVGGIKIDRTAPTTNVTLPAPKADDWYAGPVTVELAGEDTLSGVKATYYSIDGGDAQTYSDKFTFDKDGKHKLAFWSKDRAGNLEQAAEASLNIDTVDPSIKGSRDPSANANGWNNVPVTVSFDCQDDDSGIAAEDGCTAPVTLSHEGAGQSVKGTAKDRVGNSGSDTVGGINIDLTAPKVTGHANEQPNENGWYTGDVTIGWSCDDALSGTDGTCPSDSIIGGEGDNLSAGTGDVLDKAGNVAKGSVSGIKIDRTAPSLSFESPAEGATDSAASAAVKVKASDGGSGLDSVTINGGAATANGDGTYSRTVQLACGTNDLSATAKDKAGKSQSVTRKVTRSCIGISKALAPIATSNDSQGDPRATNLSAFKIKSVVPVKFRAYTDATKTQLMTTPPTGSYAKLTLGRYDNTTDTIDGTDYVSAGSANTDDMFRWTGSPDYQYIYNLATSGKAAGTYGVQLTLYAADGSVLGKSDTQYFVLRS